MKSHLALLLCLCGLSAAACFEKVDEGAVGELPCDFGAVCPPPEDGSIPTITTTPAILLADGGTTEDPCVKTEEDSLSIRQTFCGKCHQEPTHLGVAPFGFVLDDDQLVAKQSSKNTPYVTPGDAARSYVYQRVLNREMPPATEALKPTLSDVSVLYQWIVCLSH